MQTIRHIEDNGQERVVSAVSVSYDPLNGVLTGHGTPDGDVTLATGHAFVMNEHGKTVAAYSMRPQQKEQKRG